ncbi:MAG TPA: glutamate--cysteine ligase [Actinomycetales bacterium]|nr:glutamate--cysteine ligase [Actinomycetales bacterium]
MRHPVRTIGVEEELLLVDEYDGRAVPLGMEVLGRHRVGPGAVSAAGAFRSGAFEALELELKLEQVETATPPRADLQVLAADLRRRRALADRLARSVGARAAALATSPLPVEPRLTPTPRYRAISREFGLTCAEQLTCGCHVHVAVASDEEGVAVLDRIRPWLAVLTAIATNSPFWNGVDTGYAGFRTQAWSRWPSSGPTELFGSAAGYHATVAQLVATGSLLDEAMVYFDARLSRRYPTVEIRVADVCLDVDDAVLVAALSRALVDTAAAQWRAAVSPAPVSAAALRLMSWRASRSGLDDGLVHPTEQRLRPAAEVVESLLDHVRPALSSSGDLCAVEAQLGRVLVRGSGARRQRQVAAATGRLSDVVADAVERTSAEQPNPGPRTR